MKVVVHSGNIGNAVAEQLLEQGHDVFMLVRKPGKVSNKHIKELVVDFNDVESLIEAFSGKDKFFSVSPLIPSMVELAEISVKAAINSGIKHIVRSSARGASKEAPITMGQMHGTIEEMIEHAEIPYTFIQPASFYQNLMGSIPTIKNEGAFYGAIGNGQNAFVDVRDIAAVSVAALNEERHIGQTYVVTGPEVISYQDMANELSSQLGRTINYVDIPRDKLAEAYKSYGMSDWLIETLLELDDITKKGYLASGSEDVKSVLGREPIAFSQFVTDNLSLFKQ
ncbi:SDR family oxidoreductase [Aquimarina gracilis]|uniref:SDR family oxidoreductase n=1 Tax=Aquimarina gracilis TaxID=874422 RepID=A0ABU5ZU77_9FLAO|nr:SDR family oxidoreductase [Aquimarina gracilis]MEB3345107.1 SDR family oxidoreductase [Aquimarina gracilis]